MLGSVLLAVDADTLVQSTQTLLSSSKYETGGKGRGCHCKGFEETALLRAAGCRGRPNHACPGASYRCPLQLGIINRL